MNTMNKDAWLEKLADDYLSEKKKNKKRRWIYRGILVVLLLIAAVYNHFDSDHEERPHIGVIDIRGDIFSGSKASADKVVKALRKAYRSKGMEAVFLRVNSPGGSPVQADYIYDEIMYYRKKNPKIKVYAVCSDICTSAAYYISAAADEIYAAPSSLVGSIGVLYNGFGFVGAMDKLGVTRRLVTAGKNKGFLDPFSKAKPEDVIKLKAMLKVIHRQFEDKVKAGRQGRLKTTDDTFSGLFWTGEQALEMGLVDGLSTPYQLVRDKKLPKKAINYTSHGSLFERLNQMVSSSPLGLGAYAPLQMIR